MSANEESQVLPRIKSILIATDLSGRSDKALARGLLLATAYGASVRVVHVVDDDQPKSLVEEEAARAADLIEAMVKPMVDRLKIATPEIEIWRGLAAVAIAKLAAETKPDLLVMGAHRRQLLRDVFVGTTVERVIRTCERPVLMVNLDADVPYRKALAAVDLSQHSIDALKFASRVGFLGCEKLAIVHAFIPLADGLMRYADVEKSKIDEYVESIADDAHKALVHMLSEEGLARLDPEVIVEEGDPVGVIKSAVERLNPSLVVLGTRGQTGLKQMLIGSVANAVLRDLECDLLAFAKRAEED